MAAPPPPPPPPGMPPPMGSAPAMPKITPDRNALLGDIRKGKALKKAVTNDRSAPKVGGSTGSNSSPMGLPPFGGAPALPKSNNNNNNNNNNYNNNNDMSTARAPAVPQLGDIFAGGMPKLKHVSHTNSNSDSLKPPSNAPSVPSMPSLPSSRPKRSSMNFSPNAPSIPTMPPPTTPTAPSINSFNRTNQNLSTGAPPIPSGAPPIPSSHPPSTTTSPSTPSVPKQRVNILANSHRRNESTNSLASVISSKSKPKVPMKKPSQRISSSSSAFGAPPIPNSPPPIPGFTPSTPALPKFPATSAPSMPTFGAPKAPSLPTSAAPSVPSFSAPKAPALPNSAAPPPPAPPPAPAPPAPPMQSSPSSAPPPPGPPPPPSFGNAPKPNKSKAPAAGGLPFLDQINQRRNDSYVIDENAVAKKAAAPTSAPKEQETISASAPSAPSIPSAPAPSGNPLMDEIMKRTHKSSAGSSSWSKPKSSTAPTPPSAPAIPTSTAPPAPSAPSIPSEVPPSLPSSIPESFSYPTENVPPAFAMPGMTLPKPNHSAEAPLIPSSVPPSAPPSAPPSLPTSLAPPVPPSSPPTNSYNSNYNNDVSDTSSIFSESVTTTNSSFRKKAPPPPPSKPPSSTSTQYQSEYTSPTKSQPRLSVDTNSLNLTSAPTISPKVSRPSYLSAVEESSLFTNIRSKFGGGVFKHHLKSQSPGGIQNNDQIVQTQVAGNEIRKIDVSAYTIAGSANGGITSSHGSTVNGNLKMESSRFRFLDQNELPRPHKFEGRIKLYPSGRGSSVPLDLSSLS